MSADDTAPFPKGHSSDEEIRHIAARLQAIDSTLRELREYLHGSPSSPGLIATLARITDTLAHEVVQTDAEIAAHARRVEALESMMVGTSDRSGIVGRLIVLESAEVTRGKHLWALWAAVLAGAAKAIADAIAGR